jgi:hypothetical protein
MRIRCLSGPLTRLIEVFSPFNTEAKTQPVFSPTIKTGASSMERRILAW